MPQNCISQGSHVTGVLLPATRFHEMQKSQPLDTSTGHRGAAEGRGVWLKYRQTPSCASAAVGYQLVIVTALASEVFGTGVGTPAADEKSKPSLGVELPSNVRAAPFALTLATFPRRRREEHLKQYDRTLSPKLAAGCLRREAVAPWRRPGLTTAVSTVTRHSCGP